MGLIKFLFIFFIGVLIFVIFSSGNSEADLLKDCRRVTAQNFNLNADDLDIKKDSITYKKLSYNKKEVMNFIAFDSSGKDFYIYCAKEADGTMQFTPGDMDLMRGE
ncbi:MAG: hypothetical protein ACTJHL_13195 [Neisseriaceae bacterium]